MIVMIILRHGSYEFFESNMTAMPEGEPYLARLLDGQGAAIETLWFGSKDKENKLLGGGLQTYSGDLTQIVAPAGVMVRDANGDIQMSNGSSWDQINGAGASAGGGGGNLDFGSYW